MTDPKRLIVYTTTDSMEEAEKIAEAMVEQKLAACVQILPPMTSVYLWKGKVEKEQEWLISMKTTSSRYKELEAELKKIHSYETPEIIAVNIETGSPEYLKWIHESLQE